MPSRRTRIRRRLKPQSVVLNEAGTDRWITFRTMDSLTRAAGFFEAELEDVDGSITDIYESYDPAEIFINTTKVFKGLIEDIDPNHRGTLRLSGRNYLHELQGEYIIEAYGITQQATNSPVRGSSKVINIPDTTGFEVGDEVLIEDDGRNAISLSSNLLNGVVESGTYEDTETINTTYHQIGERAGDGLGIEYTFCLGEGVSGRKVLMQGRYDGSAAHYLEVFAWNYIDSAYENISDANNRFNDSSTDLNYAFDVNADHFDESGNAKIKIEHNVTGYNSADDLYLDYLAIQRTGTSELAVITAVVLDTSITVAVLDKCFELPTVTVGEYGRDVVDDLVGKYGLGMTKTGIVATSPEKFIRTFKGVTAFDAIQEIADAEEHEFGHDMDADFYYQLANFEDSGVTLTYGTSDIMRVNVDRVGSDIVNRVDVYGKVISGVPIAARAEDTESQNYYGTPGKPRIKGITIIEEKLETDSEAEALGSSIISQKAWRVQMASMDVFGYESLRAGQLITLSGVPGLDNGQYLIIEKEHIYPEAVTTLRLANFKKEFEDFIVNLIKRMRSREKEALDEDATLTKLLNFYENTTSTETIEVIKVSINDGLIAGHKTNGVIGRGYTGAGGTQVVAGRYGTETVIA